MYLGKRGERELSYMSIPLIHPTKKPFGVLKVDFMSNQFKNIYEHCMLCQGFLCWMNGEVNSYMKTLSLW